MRAEMNATDNRGNSTPGKVVTFGEAAEQVAWKVKQEDRIRRLGNLIDYYSVTLSSEQSDEESPHEEDT